jgi:ATP-dependent Clp protease protease subunit
MDELAREMRDSRGYSAAAKGEVGEVYIYDFIGVDMFGDGVTAKWFRDELAKMKGVKALNIYVNSPGGDVFEGQTIHSQLMRFQARKIMHVDGEASSAASLILMAGDERRIASGGMIMVHEPWGVSVGNADDMLHMAGTLQKLAGQYAAEYSRVTKRDEDEMREMMRAETWMTAAEALELGFVDAIDAPMKAAAASVMAGFDRSKLQYRKPVPTAVSSPLVPQGFAGFDAALKKVQEQQTMLAARRIV